MQVEMRLFLECGDDTQLQDLENEFYHIDSLGSIFIDVSRADIIDVKED